MPSRHPLYIDPEGWCTPPRTDSKLCGHALTTADGRIIPPIPALEYEALTRHPFRIADLEAAIQYP